MGVSTEFSRISHHKTTNLATWSSSPSRGSLLGYHLVTFRTRLPWSTCSYCTPSQIALVSWLGKIWIERKKGLNPLSGQSQKTRTFFVAQLFCNFNLLLHLGLGPYSCWNRLVKPPDGKRFPCLWSREIWFRPGLRRAGEINMFESCSADFTRVIRSWAETVAKAHPFWWSSQVR